MDSNDGNRFADFFKEGKYVTLKNHLYNYLLRKRAIEKCLQQESPASISGSRQRDFARRDKIQAISYIRIYHMKLSKYLSKLRKPDTML